MHGDAGDEEIAVAGGGCTTMNLGVVFAISLPCEHDHTSGWYTYHFDLLHTNGDAPQHASASIECVNTEVFIHEPHISPPHP